MSRAHRYAGQDMSARLFIPVTVLLLALAGSMQAAASTDDLAHRLLSDLEQNSAEDLFDMHGNADGRLQRLMLLRFDATAAVQSAIDRMQDEPARRELVSALYKVLGFVKDPASVPWLKSKLRLSRGQSSFDAYMPHWLDGIGFGFGNNQGFGGWPWLTGHEQWIGFFIDAFSIEQTPDGRVVLINILKGFDDPLAMQFFATRREVASDPREVLLVEAYLHQHGVPADTKRIEPAIAALVGETRNRRLLIGTADALRHEAFVPYLISTLHIAEPNMSPPQYLSQYVLQSVTFEVDMESREDWESWHSKNRQRSRDQWVQSALDAFMRRLARNPEGALHWFQKKALYRWNDMAAYPLVHSELLPRREFHSAIAGWINMSFSEFNRSRLKVLSDEIARHPDQLEDWARRLLEERDLLPASQPRTWEAYVRRANRRM